MGDLTIVSSEDDGAVWFWSDFGWICTSEAQFPRFYRSDDGATLLLNNDAGTLIVEGSGEVLAKRSQELK